MGNENSDEFPQKSVPANEQPSATATKDEPNKATAASATGASADTAAAALEPISGHASTENSAVEPGESKLATITAASAAPSASSVTNLSGPATVATTAAPGPALVSTMMAPASSSSATAAVPLSAAAAAPPPAAPPTINAAVPMLLKKRKMDPQHVVHDILALLQSYGPLTWGQIEYNLPAVKIDILHILVALGVVQKSDNKRYCVGQGIPRADTVHPATLMDEIDKAHQEAVRSYERRNRLLQALSSSSTDPPKNVLSSILQEFPEIQTDPVYTTALRNLHVGDNDRNKAMAPTKPKKKKTETVTIHPSVATVATTATLETTTTATTTAQAAAAAPTATPF